MYGIHFSGFEPFYVGPHTKRSALARPSYIDEELLGKALDEFANQLAKTPEQPRTLYKSPLRTSDPTGTTQDLIADPNAKDGPLLRYDAQVRQSLIVSQLLPLITSGQPTDSGELRTMTAAVRKTTPLWSITGPTPAAAAAFFGGDLDEVIKANERRKRRAQLPEMIVQHNDAPTFMLAAIGAAPATHPCTIECLEVAASMIEALVHPIKHAFLAVRPVKRSARVVPVLQTPSHYSFPSGHATYAYCAAEILTALCEKQFPEVRVVLQLAAQLVADNRVAAGLHYPCDSDAGQAVGYALGRWLVGQGSDYTGKKKLATGTYVASKSGKWTAELKFTEQDFVFDDTPRWRALVYGAAQEWGA